MAQTRRDIVIGTRGSALAMAQTAIVCDALRSARPELDIRVERIVTTGDARADVPISELGRGVFVSEIEAALRERRIDLAVHSAKDLPSTLPGDLALAAFLPRADARDVVVSRAGALMELPRGSRVGTSSPRRTCQLRAMRQDLDLRDIRGNVDTRLRKLAGGEFDAIVLAAAGMIRLGRESEITEWLEVETMIPCVGQGALAVETRSDDEFVAQLVRELDDPDTRAAVTAERAFLAELGAGCRAAAGAHARVGRDGRMTIVALIGAANGRHISLEREGDARDAAHLGRATACMLLRNGAAVFLGTAHGPLAGKRVAVTRPADQAGELLALLRARGAGAIACPTIAIEPARHGGELDAALAHLDGAQWMVFTSANAVRAVSDRLAALERSVPARVRLAAVGGATAEELARRIRPADFMPASATAEALAEELPDVAQSLVLFPRGDLAPDSLVDRLRSRGARVHSVVAYHTVAGGGIDELAQRTRSGQLDAIVFASPSSIKFAAPALDAARMIAAKFPAIVCIGSTTARAARELGIEPGAVAASPSTGGILEALESCLAARAPAHEYTAG